MQPRCRRAAKPASRKAAGRTAPSTPNWTPVSQRTRTALAPTALQVKAETVWRFTCRELSTDGRSHRRRPVAAGHRPQRRGGPAVADRVQFTPLNHLKEPTVPEQPILVETLGRVGVITLNRPKQLNALNDALMDALGAALLAFDADDGIGAIVITGNDTAFAAGADITAMVDWQFMDVFRSDFITRNWETIRRVRKPVIASVAGFAMGGGCELALACDIVIAAESARFALPEVKLGMLPGAGGTQRLPHAIGKAKAMDMCLSARVLDAAEADRHGLVSRVVPNEQLRAQTLALAAKVAGFSLPALMAIKESVNRAFEGSLTEGIGFERRQLHARFASDDAHEGMRAFLEKRAPVFTHR
jgi:cyclohex-1-ene-1-carboxyl-CoA hydratase